ncbi:MAG: pentapeptide repeat-containing protein [Pseudonocardiaceae bacterium]
MTVRRAEWLHGRAIGLRLSAERLEDVYVEGVRLDYSVIHVERVKGLVVFCNCSFREAEISGDLSDVVFDECVLAGVRFAAQKAKGADLKTSRLDGAHGLLSLRGATITTEQALSIADQLAAEAGLSVES